MSNDLHGIPYVVAYTTLFDERLQVFSCFANSAIEAIGKMEKEHPQGCVEYVTKRANLKRIPYHWEYEYLEDECIAERK